MIKNFSFYLALRYLRPKRTFVSVITVISVLGVAFGVAALIIVISVMRGFHQQIQELASNYETHIEASDRYGDSMLPSKERARESQEENKPWRDVLKAIKATPGVVSATPMVRGLLLVEGPNGNIVPCLMWGLKEEDGDRLAQKHEKFIDKGKMDLRSTDKGSKIVIDEMLANAWGLDVGDKVSVYSPGNLRQVAELARQLDEKKGEERKQVEERIHELSAAEPPMEISGIFSPPRLQDSNKMPVCIVPLFIAQELRDMEDGISSIGIEVADPYKAGEVKEELEKTAFPKSWVSATWIEQHKQLFDTVENELEMMYFILFFIVIVAAFCVMNTMITVTVQKRKEIGIISALGSRIGQVMWVFLIQGMIVGAFGALSGLGMGALVVTYRNEIRAFITKVFKHEIFDSSIYGLIKIPAKMDRMDLTIICVGAFLLCTLASLIPAFLAARTEPAEALRD